MPTALYSQSMTVTTGAAGQKISADLPALGTFRMISVGAPVTAGGGPLWCAATIRDRSGIEIGVVSGWVRADGNYASSNSLWWNGAIALSQIDAPQLIVRFRNDTGADSSAGVNWLVTVE